MKKTIEINVIFLVIFIIFSSQSIAKENILPLPKPTIDKETKEIIAKKKRIYPKKKPVEKKILIALSLIKHIKFLFTHLLFYYFNCKLSLVLEFLSQIGLGFDTIFNSSSANLDRYSHYLFVC